MLSRQRDLHPDKFGSSGERMVSLAKELSGRINRAYEILADPLKRAEYIVGSSSREIKRDRRREEKKERGQELIEM